MAVFYHSYHSSGPGKSQNIRTKRDRYKKADGLGLFVEVMPIGSQLWRWKYRIFGTEKRLSMGRYPEVSLADARAARDDARTQLAAGSGPSIKRKRDKLLTAQSAATTFNLIADEYIKEKMVGEDRAEAAITKARWMPETASTVLRCTPSKMVASWELACLSTQSGQGCQSATMAESET
jgi:hypothetical protein